MKSAQFTHYHTKCKHYYRAYLIQLSKQLFQTICTQTKQQKKHLQTRSVPDVDITVDELAILFVNRDDCDHLHQSDQHQ